MGILAKTKQRFRATSWATGAGVAAASAGLLLSPAMCHKAHACGGFWCSQAAPVDQSGEEIIFVDNPDDTVTAVIRIAYVGPSTKFAWVLPIPGKPEVGVSSNVAFQRLEQATAPQYKLEQVIEGMCRQEYYTFASDGAGAGGNSSAPPTQAPKAAVQVIEQGSVGHYDYVVISLDPTLAAPVDVATNWFKAQGYDVTGLDGDVLGPYLADGLNLLAFKLTKGSDSGAIRPVVITYQSDLPMIPIRPTAVAAQDDMGIKVWVAADKQAVPKNYKSLVVNEALINWFNFQSNYAQVVTAAANEAGGQGFVTELAGPTSKYTDQIFSATDEMQWQQLKSQTFTSGIDAIFAANSYYRFWDGWREAIKNSVSLPAGVSIDDFGRNPNAYSTTAVVDIPKFFTELESNLIKPARDAQTLLNSRPYLTRLYSTMSADEMTVDPAFTYNSDLADVSNVHTAKEYISCNPNISTYEAPWRIELPQGGVIRGMGGNAWPIAADALPANLKVVQLSTKGAGVVVTDNSHDISMMLFDLTGQMPSAAGVPTPPKVGMPIGGQQTIDLQPDMTGKSAGANSGGSDCSVHSAGSAASTGAPWLLASLGLALAWRNRRRARG